MVCSVLAEQNDTTDDEATISCNAISQAAEGKKCFLVRKVILPSISEIRPHVSSSSFQCHKFIFYPTHPKEGGRYGGYPILHNWRGTPILPDGLYPIIPELGRYPIFPDRCTLSLLIGVPPSGKWGGGYHKLVNRGYPPGYPTLTVRTR